MIDWDGVALGDSADGLAAIGASYGQQVLGRVLARLSWSDDRLAIRTTTIGNTFALQQALSAHRDGDADELADGLADYR